MGLFSKKKKDFIKLETEELIEWNEPNGEGCLASDRITRDGFKVGYMYREEPDTSFPDSGWRFMSGDEDERYMNKADNFNAFRLNTVCNYDRDIISHLHSAVGAAFIRVDAEHFEPDDGTKPIFLAKQDI